MDDASIARTMAKVLEESGLSPQATGDIVSWADGAALITAAPMARPTGFWSVQLRWDGALKGEDYLAALPIANSITADRPWMGVSITAEDEADLLDALGEQGKSVVVRARIVHPTPEDEAQVRALAASAVAGAVTLASTFQASFPERVGEEASGAVMGAVVAATAGQSPAITRERVASWFERHGVADVPYDEESQVMNLSLQGSPVDIVLRDSTVCEIRISAALTGTGSSSGEPDPAAALHMCNRVTADESLASVCVVRHEEGWFVVGSTVVPAGAGLSDAQLDRTIREGILAAATSVRAVMHRLS